MKTKTIATFIAFLLVFPLLSGAQNKKHQHEERKKEIEIKKIGFITENLQLTEAEAQAFWPVYNDFQSKKEACMKENRGKKDPVNYDELSEKELNDLADAEIVKGTKMLELRKEYNEKFKKVLPVKKVVMLYDAEKEFKKVLLKDIGKKHNSNQKNNIPE